MNTQWTQPQTLPLAKRLRKVATQLREATPHLMEAQVKAFEGMAATARLASQPRRLSDTQLGDRREPHE